MRKLQFIAQCKHASNAVNLCHLTQDYVTNLLLDHLVIHGFKTVLDRNTQNIDIRVDDNQIRLSVECEQSHQHGQLFCHIHAHTDEEQAWFKKIETQSMVKQLANAIENTLNHDDSISDLKWIG